MSRTCQRTVTMHSALLVASTEMLRQFKSRWWVGPALLGTTTSNTYGDAPATAFERGAGL